MVINGLFKQLFHYLILATTALVLSACGGDDNSSSHAKKEQVQEITSPNGQTCRVDAVSTTPNDRFADNFDGTVKDKQTGLIWMRCPLGQTWDGETRCIGDALQFTWSEALYTGTGYDFANRNDWKLPDISELQTIVEKKCYEPTVNLNIFPESGINAYWSRSPVQPPYGDDTAWSVDFRYGNAGKAYKSAKLSLRLVRRNSN